MRGTLIFWANGFWNDSPSKYQIFCLNVTDVRTLYARPESSVGNESPCVRHRLLQFRSTSQWVGGDLKWFGSRSQIIWREWENLSQLRMWEGGWCGGNSSIWQQTVASCFLTSHINWFSTRTYTRTDGTIHLATLCSEFETFLTSATLAY